MAGNDLSPDDLCPDEIQGSTKIDAESLIRLSHDHDDLSITALLINRHDIIIQCRGDNRLYPEHGEDKKQLTRHADQAMLEAKSRDKTIFADKPDTWTRLYFSPIWQLRITPVVSAYSLLYSRHFHQRQSLATLIESCITNILDSRRLLSQSPLIRAIYT